jgi:hypothetical protein
MPDDATPAKAPPYYPPNHPLTTPYRWFLPTYLPTILEPMVVKIELRHRVPYAFVIGWKRRVPCHELDAIGVWGPWIDMPEPTDFPGLPQTQESQDA